MSHVCVGGAGDEAERQVVWLDDVRDLTTDWHFHQTCWCIAVQYILPIQRLYRNVDL